MNYKKNNRLCHQEGGVGRGARFGGKILPLNVKDLHKSQNVAKLKHLRDT